MNALVSVIIPVYNREHLVSQAIESVLAQTYQPVEIILINDGSKDNSLSILKEYERRFPSTIKVLDQENQGQIAARNNGINVAQGDYIAFLDSDDLWMEDKLIRQIPIFEAGVGLVYSGAEIIDEKGKVIRTEFADEAITGNIYPQLLVKNRMTGGTVVVTKESLDRVGVFSMDFKAAENWDLWLRICQFYTARVVSDPLIKYRIHSDNMSADNHLMLQAKLQIIQKHCDLNSKNSVIAHHSRLAHADYHYRKGLNYFSTGKYRQARREFFSVLSFSYKYRDTWIRLLRCFLGRAGNNILRSMKRG